MKGTLTEKILRKHLVEGSLVEGEEIGLKVDQTLTQDATGTMSYLQFEVLGIPKVKTKLSVSYVDHNMLGVGFENADDHRYLQSAAAKYGAYFSRPGNGICHQVHLERFAVPGETLLGSDSHTPTAGGMGILAFGAGGLDVAVAMAGRPFYINVPKIHGIELSGELNPWVTAKDVILEILRKLTVKGGVGKIIEYHGVGVRNLTVPERATITNMGAELGATTSIFPSDENTKDFLKKQGRVGVWTELKPDKNPGYDGITELDLSKLEPLIAKPHSPDNVVPVSELAGIKVDQVAIGSCTNSSYADLMAAAGILEGRRVHPDVSLVISPGSRQVLEMIAQNGALKTLISAGARILESACGPCIGMGQAPPSGGVSVRTFNRNFAGRSGTLDAGVYLASPQVAAVAAIEGEIKDPRDYDRPPKVKLPERFLVDDSMIIPPPKDSSKIKVVRGPNIRPLPKNKSMGDDLSGRVLIKVSDNITTDHILPAGSKILPLRSNIPAISEFVFHTLDPEFVLRAKAGGGGFIVGGLNYGQGSSREHAALAPMYLGVRAVFAKGFARIHKANLINFGILPLTLDDEKDYDVLEQGQDVLIEGVRKALSEEKPIKAKVGGKVIEFKHDLNERQAEVVLAGGLLNYVREKSS